MVGLNWDSSSWPQVVWDGCGLLVCLCKGSADVCCGRRMIGQSSPAVVEWPATDDVKQEGKKIFQRTCSVKPATASSKCSCKRRYRGCCSSEVKFEWVRDLQGFLHVLPAGTRLSGENSMLLLPFSNREPQAQTLVVSLPALQKHHGPPLIKQPPSQRKHRPPLWNTCPKTASSNLHCITSTRTAPPRSQPSA